MVRRNDIGLVAADEAEAMIDAMDQLLGQPEACQGMGAGARQAAGTHCAWPLLDNRLADFYRRLEG